MEIKIGSKVKHIPSGDIVTVEKINPKSYVAKNVNGWKQIRIQKSDCELYIEPVKEKSFYDKMRERNMEDAKKLPTSPKEIGQHILWLKMAVIDRVEKIENLTDDKIQTFRSGEKFGFSEHYVNLLMHYAYEAGKKQATDNLTRHFEVTTRDMKTAMDSIIKALDDNGLLPYDENNY
jgi:hypothetical protein